MEIYAFKDKRNTTSSSGGAFPAIIKAVEKIESSKPVVYGAAFDENFDVRHIRTDSEDGYRKLRGSKYVRSILGDTIQNAIVDLQEGKAVIFSGTPCQVAAMKKRAASCDCAKLYLVDIVCHGTPQSIIWEDFRKWLEEKNGSTITDFSFRYGKARWKSYPTMVAFQNGRSSVNGFDVRRYTELFYSDLTLNKACYTCKFANTTRPSDITIGDFWGIRRVIPSFPYKEEVSQILVSTDKGKCVLKKLSGMEDCILSTADLEDAKPYQSCFNEATKMPEKAEQFWQDYHSMPFEMVLKKYAGYNLKGKCKYFIKRFLGETRILELIKWILKR